MATSFDTVRTAFEQRNLRITNLTATSFKAQCPAHDDRDPSLSVTYSPPRTLVTCHANTNCDYHAIMLGLGLTDSDLFDDDANEKKGWASSEPIIEYTYENPEGEPHMIVGRFPPKRFLQRLPGGTYRQGLGSRKPCLYRMTKVLDAAANGQPIWYVEGEKDVHAMETLGLVATTSPKGGNSWHDYYADWLQGASEVIIVADRDQTGENHTRQVVASLTEHGIPCRTVQARSGKDAYDHIRHGFDAGDFVPFTDYGFTFVDGVDLEQTEYPEPEYLVENMLVRGSTSLLFAGPKKHKSYMAQDIALSVACGGTALGGVQATKGGVLYFSVDNDDMRRVRSRHFQIMGHDGMPGDAMPIRYVTDLEITSLEALAAVRKYIRDNPATRLIVLDTLGKVEPSITTENDAYRVTGQVLSRWHELAVTENVHVLMVHHDRKSETTDFVDKALGSRNVGGSVGALFYIESKRGSKEGKLHMTGRDVIEDIVDLRKVGPLWIMTDRIEGFSTIGEPQQRVIEFVAQASERGETVTTKEVLAHFAQDYSEVSVRQYLARATDAGRINRLARGVYSTAS